MRKRRALLVLLGALLVAGAPGQAEARGKHGSHGHGYHKGHAGYGYRGGQRHNHGYKHHRHHGAHFSLWLGPLWYPAYAYPRYHPYHHETAVIVEKRTVYVERPASAAPAGSWWYYCESAGGYYPDVASCPEGWVKVPPRPE